MEKCIDNLDRKWILRLLLLLWVLVEIRKKKQNKTDLSIFPNITIIQKKIHQGLYKVIIQDFSWIFIMQLHSKDGDAVYSWKECWLVARIFFFFFFFKLTMRSWSRLITSKRQYEVNDLFLDENNTFRLRKIRDLIFINESIFISNYWYRIMHQTLALNNYLFFKEN